MTLQSDTLVSTHTLHCFTECGLHRSCCDSQHHMTETSHVSMSGSQSLCELAFERTEHQLRLAHHTQKAQPRHGGAHPYGSATLARVQ